MKIVGHQSSSTVWERLSSKTPRDTSEYAVIPANLLTHPSGVFQRLTGVDLDRAAVLRDSRLFHEASNRRRDNSELKQFWIEAVADWRSSEQRESWNAV